MLVGCVPWINTIINKAGSDIADWRYLIPLEAGGTWQYGPAYGHDMQIANMALWPDVAANKPFSL